MSDPRHTPEALAELQDSIWREKVLRARAMTPEERFEGGIEQTNFVMRLMLDGTMSQLRITETSSGWRELRKRMDRLRKTSDHGFYADTKPT